MDARNAVLTLSSVAVLFTGAIVACGDDDATEAITTTDGGADAQPDVPVVVTNDTESKQLGKVIRAQTEDEAVPGVTVTIAGKSVATNDNGDYEIIVPRNTPYQMTLAAEGFYKLIEQEWILKQETLERGSTSILLADTAKLLAGLLDGRKPEKGLVLVKINPRPPCTSEEGSTVTIDPPGEAKVSYFGGALPDSQQPAAKAGTSFSAIFYNVEVGVPVKVTVKSPLCTQEPFPIEITSEKSTVTYTGVQKAEPGEALSYLRVYIKDPVVADAGADGN